MSAIEKLFVQIFDRRRQIVEQLNHQKQLYDQNLASKLLIQGITPPPWLLNSDKFASSSASSSDPEGLSKEELISGLLLPCPQPLPSYSNAAHLYGKPLSTVGDGELQHELFNATSAGCKGLDDCRQGFLPQCLFRGLEDVHNHVAESPQERVALDIYADLDQSLARVQRSKSRQKDFELRSSGKKSGKCQLEDNPPTGPRNQDVLKEGSATTAGGVLSSSKDESLPKKQDISSNEERDFGCTAYETPGGVLSSSKDESFPKKQDISSNEERDFSCTANETPGGVLSSSKDDSLPKKQDISSNEEGGWTCTANEAACGVLSSSKDESLPKKQDISSKEEGDFRCTTNETDAPTNWLSPHSDCRDLSVEYSLVAADSVSSKGGISSYLLKESVVEINGSCGRKCANSNLLTEEIMETQGLSKENDISMCHTKKLDASSDIFSPEEHIAQLAVPGETPAEGALVDSANSNLLTEELMEECQGLSKEDDNSMCYTKELVAPSDLLSPEEHIDQLEIEQPNSLSSKRVKHATNSSGKHEVLGETPAEGALVDNLLQMVGGQALGLSSTKLANEVDLENYGGLCSGKNSRESQGRYEASIGQCNTEVRFSLCKTAAECLGATANELPTCNSEDDMKYASVMQRQKLDDAQTQAAELAERSGATANELATSNSEDDMKNASVRQIQKLDDAQPQSAELQATCFSKENFSVSPKLLELHTPSSTSAVGCSWPRQKRRKIESVISKSASPHLRVNPSSIFSTGVYVAKSCTGDFSATETKSDISSLSILLEHSSITQHKEEKLSCQGSHDVKTEKLQVSSVSCLTQRLISTSQKCLHEVDLTREKRDLSFSTSKVDADNADNNICRRENSLEVQNTINCLGGSRFMEHKEAVGAEGDGPDLEYFTFEKKWKNAQNIGDIDVNMDDKVDDKVADIMNSSPTAWCQQKSLQTVKDFDCLGDSPMEHTNTVGRKAVVADLENFTFYSKCDDTHHTGDLERSIAIDLPKNTIDRAEFLERLCRSASLGIPLSHFHASCSSESKVDACHSVPVGILEQTDLRNTSALNDVTCQLLNASHTFTKNVEYSEFEGNSFSHYSPTHGTPFAWDFKGPCMSPFGKSIDGVTAKSRSSSKRGSSNPEHTCFPIEESGEEDFDADDNDHNGPEEMGSARKSCSASEEYMNAVALDPGSKMVSSGSVSTETSSSTSDKRRSSSPEFTCFPVEERTEQRVNEAAAQTCQEESGSARQPLRDISENATAVAVHPSSKRGTESFSRASSTNEINRKISQNSQAQNHQSGHLRKRKVTQNSSLGTTGKKHFEASQTRFSKPKVSVKSDLETRGGSFSVKEPKPSNIVSSIKSFLPLVQQKQAASCAPVKKDVIRVKALEAAEAAKRLEEKKENERLQKKEARKLERARQEQEKLRQLELQKKAKEEERKRKDAEIAERKRQREEEEEERRERERKRKRVGEARKQKKGHEDKMPLGKEDCKSQEEDGKTENHATSSPLPIASGDLKTNELGLSSDPSQKQKDVSVNVAGCSTPTPDLSASQTIREKSYDISPYCCSDDEGDEEDELPNNKFIPAWASKSSIKMALACFNTFDPDVIFPPSSFCSLNEVLLPRELKQR